MREADRDEEQRVLRHLEGDDLRRDGRADVRAEDHADRLRERHQAGGDEAHDEHGGDRRRLDHGSHERAGQEPDEAVVGEPAENRLHPVAGDRLEGVGHLVHAEEEQGEPPEQPHQEREDLELRGCGGGPSAIDSTARARSGAVHTALDSRASAPRPAGLHDRHGDRRELHDALRLGAEHQVREPRPALAAHHDQPRVRLLGDLQDSGRRQPDDELGREPLRAGDLRVHFPLTRQEGRRASRPPRLRARCSCPSSAPRRSSRGPLPGRAPRAARPAAPRSSAPLPPPRGARLPSTPRSPPAPGWADHRVASRPWVSFGASAGVQE